MKKNIETVKLEKFTRKDHTIDFVRLSCFFVKLIAGADFAPGVRVEVEYSKAEAPRMILTFFVNDDNAGLMFFKSKYPQMSIEKFSWQFAAALNFIAGNHDLGKIRKLEAL